MAVLEPYRDISATPQNIRELRVGIPLEAQRAVQSFYVDVLGLAPWSDGRQIPGGWGVGDAECGMFLEFRHDPAVDPLRRRFVLAVVCLDRFEQRLQEHDWPYERTRGIGYADARIFLHDPAGHRVEVCQLKPF